MKRISSRKAVKHLMLGKIINNGFADYKIINGRLMCRIIGEWEVSRIPNVAAMNQCWSKGARKKR